MTEQARREHAEVMRARYQEADKRERGAMLDEYCRVTGCHREAAIRRLRAAPQRPRRGSRRPPRYGRDLLPLLARVWQASDYLSGKLLRPIVPALVSALQRHHGLAVSAAAHAALLAASRATLGRMLRPLRVDGRDAGAVQGDLVLHCGETTEGLYCATLVAVDVATTWTELQAIWGLHQQRVTGGIQHVHQRLPFPLREWPRDNGSESVNACWAGAATGASASPAPGRTARTIRLGSSSAMASSCIASSAPIATARARPGASWSACMGCCVCSTTSSARSASS